MGIEQEPHVVQVDTDGTIEQSHSDLGSADAFGTITLRQFVDEMKACEVANICRYLGVPTRDELTLD